MLEITLVQNRSNPPKYIRLVSWETDVEPHGDLFGTLKPKAIRYKPGDGKPYWSTEEDLNMRQIAKDAARSVSTAEGRDIQQGWAESIERTYRAFLVKSGLVVPRA